MEAAIAGVYSHNKDGEEYITRNGNPYLKVLFVQNDVQNGKSIYESFFLTPKAHFRAEMLFAALDKECPAASEIGESDFRGLISEKLNIEIGKNKGGYDTVVKFSSLTPEIEPIDEIAEQSADDPTDPFGDEEDPDLDEEIPF